MPTVKTASKTTTTASLIRESVEISGDVAAMITEFVQTRDLIRSLEGAKKELDAAIKEALGDAEVGTLDGTVRIEVSHRSRETADSTVLKEAFPEAWEAAKKVTDYTVLVVK
jgi:predicted phage-related endonuclease